MMEQPFKNKSWRFRRFIRADEAVSALEYAILVGVIAVAVGLALAAFGIEIQGAIAAIGNQVDNLNTGTGVVN